MNIDVLIVGVYFLFLIAIGYYFKNYASNSTSDYFSGGGKMLWWMVGATAFMTQFSAWTFTGAVGKAFNDGWSVTVVFFANAIGYLFCYFWFAPKSRQLRIVTPMEGMKMRFGRTSEQSFTWATIPPNIISAGVWLNGLAIFVSAVFGVPVGTTIIVTGTIVLLMSLTGGAWAVIASDFMQMIVITIVTIACAGVAVIKGGGFTKIMEVGLPEHAISGPGVNYSILFVIWVVMIVFKQFFSVTSLTGGAYRYFPAKDSENAKKAALLAFCLMVVGPIIWFLPAWFVRGFHPDTALWGLETLGNKVKDGAYLVFVRNEMPAGMVGLMMAGIFSATMSSMDSGLNRNAGIIIRNFYSPILKPNATEKELMAASKAVTLILGVLIILVGVFISSLKNLSLFNITIYIGALLDLPILIPGVLGFIVKKTPDWAAWASLIVGLMVSCLVTFVITPEMVQETLGLSTAFTAREASDLKMVMALVGQIVITGGFFVSTKFFFKGFKSKEREEEYNTFFKNLNTPVVSTHSDEIEVDNGQREILGKLTVVFGLGAMLLFLVPNPLWGRFVFIFIGGTVTLIGVALKKSVKGKTTGTEIKTA
jgi:Na+/proline symporter